MKADLDLRKAFFQQIVLAGGSTMFPGTLRRAHDARAHPSDRDLTRTVYVPFINRSPPPTRLWRPPPERGAEAGPARRQDPDIGAARAQVLHLDRRVRGWRLPLVFDGPFHASHTQAYPSTYPNTHIYHTWQVHPRLAGDVQVAVGHAAGVPGARRAHRLEAHALIMQRGLTDRAIDRTDSVHVQKVFVGRV